MDRRCLSHRLPAAHPKNAPSPPGPRARLQSHAPRRNSGRALFFVFLVWRQSSSSWFHVSFCQLSNIPGAHGVVAVGGFRRGRCKMLTFSIVSRCLPTRSVPFHAEHSVQVLPPTACRYRRDRRRGGATVHVVPSGSCSTKLMAWRRRYPSCHFVY